MKRRVHKMFIVDNDIYPKFQNAANYRCMRYCDALDAMMLDFIKETDEIREEDSKRQEARLLDPNEPLPPEILRQQFLLESRIRDATHRIEKGIVTDEADIQWERDRIEDARNALQALPRKLSETQLNRRRELEHKSIHVRYGRQPAKPKPKVVDEVEAEPTVNLVPSMSTDGEGEEVVM